MAIFPGGTSPVASQTGSILKKILAIPWAQRVPTLITTNEKLAKHRLIGDPNGPTRGNDERPAPMTALIGRTLILLPPMFDYHLLIRVFFFGTESAKPPSTSPISHELVIRPLFQIGQVSQGGMASIGSTP